MEVEAGKAEADVAAQFEQARQTAQDRLESTASTRRRRGPGRSTSVRALPRRRRSRRPATRPATQTENIGRALRSEAINVGRGYPGQIAGVDGRRRPVRQPGGQHRPGDDGVRAPDDGHRRSWQGLGNQAIAGWGNILNAASATRWTACKAEQQASSGWGDVLGTGWLACASSSSPRVASFPSQAGRWRASARECHPVGGAIPDDIPAEIDGGAPAQLNAGEFIVPQDVVKWLGEKGMQQVILKSRKEMTGSNGERPAQPEMGPPPGPP